MPSQKPRITVYTDEETNLKLAYISKLENRSSSNYTEYLIKKAIQEYEKNNGELKIVMQEKEENGIIKIIKWVTGITPGEIIGDKAVEMIHEYQDKKKNK